jgi:hypothetical protein
VLPVALTVGFVVVLYFFFDSRSGNGLISVLSYFYQVVDLIFVQNNKSTYIMRALSSLSNIQISGGSTTDVCIWPNLDFKDIQFVFMLGTLAILLVPWLIILLLVALYHCCSRRGVDSSDAPDPLLDRPRARRVSLGNFLPTLLSLFNFSYASFTRGAFTLLQCVSIPGLSGLFLFGDASVPCFSEFQKPLFAVVIFAALFPLLLFTWIGTHRGKDLSESPTRSASYLVCFLSSLVFLFRPFFLFFCLCSSLLFRSFLPFLCVLFRFLSSLIIVSFVSFLLQMLTNAFRPEMAFWGCVLLFKRFVLLLLYTFVPTLFLRQLVLTFVFFVFACAYPLFQPFRERAIYYLHLLCSALLVIFSVLNLPAASFLSQSISPNATFSEYFSRFNVIQEILLPLPLVIGVLLFVHDKMRKRCPPNGCCGNGGRTQKEADSDVVDPDSSTYQYADIATPPPHSRFSSEFQVQLRKQPSHVVDDF